MAGLVDNRDRQWVAQAEGMVPFALFRCWQNILEVAAVPLEAKREIDFRYIVGDGVRDGFWRQELLTAVRLSFFEHDPYVSLREGVAFRSVKQLFVFL